MSLWTPPGYRADFAGMPVGDQQIIVMDGNEGVVRWLFEVLPPYVEGLPTGPPLRRAWVENKDDQTEGLRVIASVDHTERWGDLLHVSVSCWQRDPTWEELKAIRAVWFDPERTDVMQVLPRRRHYVNHHPHCFHLWTMPQSWEVV